MHSACVFFPASFLQIRNSFFLSLGGYKIVFLFHKNGKQQPERAYVIAGWKWGKKYALAYNDIKNQLE